MNAKLMVLALGLIGSFGLTGCKSITQADYDAAIDENTQLRERLATLQGNVRQANERNAQVSQENERLRSENSRLASQAAAVPAAQPVRANSGFEGISGVDVGYGESGEIVVGVAGDVLFSSGKASLLNNAKTSLDQIVGVINRQYSGNVIRVEGHTDSDPIKKSGWKTNERLGAERAMAVEQYLVSKGIKNDRIYAATFGASKPKGTKKDSRRVEIVILGGGA
ncbi:MAG: OmpA family protein [Phycisphaerales bacterium]